jgi:Zn-finger in Ran binding protein and others
VKFTHVEAAAAILREQSESMKLVLGVPVRFDYSFSGTPGHEHGPGDHRQSGLENGWYCKTCHKVNFERREVCFRCKSPKPSRSRVNFLFLYHVWYVASGSIPGSFHVNDGTLDISPVFSPLLLLQGLDVLTTEETVRIYVCVFCH